MYKRKIIMGMFALLSVVLLFVFLKPSKVSANDYLSLTPEERISVAQSQYENYINNPDKKTEVLITFADVTTDDIVKLSLDEIQIISAFHSFSANGKTVTGSYIDCDNKTSEQVLADYYDSIYDLVNSQINYYDNYIKSLRHSFGDISPESMNILEKELSDAKIEYEQFKLQRSEMEKGNFSIIGFRVVAQNSTISELIKSEKVFLVEKLDFDNNNLVTPVIISKRS